MKRILLQKNEHPEFAAEVAAQATTKKRRHDCGHGRKNMRACIASAAECVVREARLSAENTGEVKTLMRDGKWVVPENERPKGWERML